MIIEEAGQLRCRTTPRRCQLVELGSISCTSRSLLQSLRAACACAKAATRHLDAATGEPWQQPSAQPSAALEAAPAAASWSSQQVVAEAPLVQQVAAAAGRQAVAS